MTHKILVVLEVIGSKADVYGNRYFAIRATRTSDGAKARGHVDAKSNAESSIARMVGDYEHYMVIEKELPIREFNRITRGWRYLGCSSERMNSEIIDQWDGGK